ncbi:chymotrypsin inhibitor-like [Ascaphus truei]|uniref:chymotrypsin inhibitor-like n=1 Tax=Ascaphus truei TaxID=8439 RepID=UPI003F5ADB95
MNSGKAMTRVLVISLLLVTEFGLSLGTTADPQQPTGSTQTPPQSTQGAVLYTQPGGEPCPEHSMYLECASGCFTPPTCGLPPVAYVSPNMKCPAVCVTGCFCTGGYMHNSSGACVLPENCS